MGLSLTISESNVSKEDNTSKITATLKISSSTSWNYYSRSGYIQIDGTKYSFSHSFSTGTTTLATKSKTVTHDSDGGGSITVKGYYSTGVSLGNLSISKTYKLTQIDRTYTIKFNSNTTDTVSNMPSSQTKTYGKTLTLSSKVPTRTGYTFKEWNTSKSGTGTSYKTGGSYKTNAADTLYAIWTENTYNVTYTLPSGYATFTSNSSTSITVTYKYTQTNGKIPTINVATGYSFKGFNINGTRYASGALFKTTKGSVSITSVAAVAADFNRLTAKLTFTGSNITTFYMEQGTGTSFKMPSYPGALEETQEFKYWTSGSDKYYAGSSYTFSTNKTLTAYIGTKADEIFRYYVPTTIESSSQKTSLFLTDFASIGSSYTIPSNSPGNKVENGTYQFKYWTTTFNKKFTGATYNYVIPKILLDTIENGFSGNYNSEHNLYKVGWIDSSIGEGDGKTFYAVYVDATKSPIKVSRNNFAYIKDTKDTTGSGAQAIQKDYSDYILNNIEDNDIVLHSNKFVAYVKYTLPSEEVKLNISNLSIVGSNPSDQIATTTTLITVGLESYIFFSGAIDSQASPIETTTITISGVKDILSRDVDNISFSIKPLKIIRDISPTGDIVSLFNQNYTKLSGNNELQIDGDLRLFGTNIYLGENGDAPLLLESSELIRKYQYETDKYGALTGYTGNGIGTLTRNDAKFDVVSMTWSGGEPAAVSPLVRVGYTEDTYKPYFTLGDRRESASIGEYSFTIGHDNAATGTYSVAIGTNYTDTSSIVHYNQATAIGSVAVGRGSTASNSDAIALGCGNTASGNSSTAIGCVSSASGSQSVSIGYHTSADYAKQFVCGAYNASSNAIFIVGNGTSDSANNALELSNSGSLTLAGDLTVSKHSSAIGTVVSDYLKNDTYCPTATGTEVCSVSLDIGVWLLIGAVRFSANATGIRRANFSTTPGSTDANIQITAGSNTQKIQLRVVKLAVVTSNSTPVYLNAYQDSGSTLTLFAGSEGNLRGGSINAITAVRIA